MNVDYLIVGQGIAGTMLSYSLMQAGASVLVIDEYKENSSSRVAAGVVNPVSGRRFTVSWLYDEIYPIAMRTYSDLEALLGIPVYKERDLWTVLPSEQLRAAFFDRTSGLDYMRLPSAADVARYDQWLDQPYGAAIIKGGTVLLQQFLPLWREYLIKHNSLLEERFQPSKLQTKPNSVTYGDIHAQALIFCEGAQTPHNPWFSTIPFLLNKGEVLTVRVPGFETADIVKRSISMVPVPGQHDIYWVGATFAWDYPDENPTAEKRAFLESGLQQLLKVPYEVLDHQAAVRPSGTDRRPMLGMHPEIPSIGLFNGLGTKGSSLAPAMAAQMTAHLIRNAPLWPETDIKRFFNRYKG